MWWTFSSDVTVIFHVFSHKTEAATAKTIARRRPLPPHPKPPPRLRRVFVGVENFGFRRHPLPLYCTQFRNSSSDSESDSLISGTLCRQVKSSIQLNPTPDAGSSFGGE